MSEFAIFLAVLSLFMTLFTVLTERKFLAYSQRRMGPILMGRNGAFQIVLDLVKLLTKEVFLIPRTTTSLAPFFLALLFATQLLFSQNFIWASSLSVFSNVDSLILYHLILILLSNILFVLVGLLSQSRYAIIGTVRALVHVISLDIFVTVLYSILVFGAHSAHFNEFALIQNSFWFVFLFAPLAFQFIVVLLLEAKRAPFDHAETESEVVAGYAVEYSGSMMMIFLLAEYLHLLIASVHFVLFFMGAWINVEIFLVLPPFFLTPHEALYFYELFNTMWV